MGPVSRRYVNEMNFGFGSWPCQNAGAGRTRRTLFFFGAMSSIALASPLGNCGPGRTRFPSVYALSAFLHGQGQALSFAPGLLDGGSWSVVARISAVPRSIGTMA